MDVFLNFSFERGDFRVSALFVAADLPPFKAFEFGHLFGAVLLIPAAPAKRVRGQTFIRDFLEREESPASHLPGGARIRRQIDELRHYLHSLLAHENAAIGNVAARAIPHGGGRSEE